MASLEFSSEIQATQKQLFDFHTNFKNVTIVTPPFIKVRFTQPPEKMEVGSELSVEINQFGIWLPWDVKVETLIPHSLMVDYQSGRGPFKTWRHEHIFESKNGRTYLIDKIHYSLRFGLLGIMTDMIIIQFVQKMIFEYRHKKTKEYFQQHD